MLMHRLIWKNTFNFLIKIIPQLSPSLHKGQLGRIGVIGGSPDYCGAPYYSGAASLQFGADLCTIYCAHEASIPIKSYSPEIMVTPFYRMVNDEFVQTESEYSNILTSISMNRLHSLVIGPGLGRNSRVGEYVMNTVVKAAMEKELSLTIDADGLYFLTQGSYIDTIVGYHRCVLTPNINEFRGIVKTVVTRLQDSCADICTGVDAPRSLWGSSLRDLEATLNMYQSDYVNSDTDIMSIDDIHNVVSLEISQSSALASYQSLVNRVIRVLTHEIQSPSNDAHGDEVVMLHLGHKVHLLSRLLGGVTILVKGQNDVVAAAGKIEWPDETKRSVDRLDGDMPVVLQKHEIISAGSVRTEKQQSMRRCGGQGDLLAGCVGVSTFWSASNSNITQMYDEFDGSSTYRPTCVAPNSINKNINISNPISRLSMIQMGNLMGAVLASSIMKTSSLAAFGKHRRGTSSVHILNEISSTFYELTGR